MSTNANVEAVSTINYQFTAIPTNLFYLLDNNTRTLLFCLIQSSSYFAKEDGFFYITKEAIGELTNLSVNVITAAIDTLYINGLVYVQTVGKSKGKYVNHYKVNFEEFRRFEEFTIEELKNPLNKIEMVKYKNNYQPQYIKDYLSNNEGKQVCKEQRKQERKKVITNIDNINNIENKDNINKNNINIYNNILEENSEEIGFGDNPISENKEFENYEEIEEVGLVENPTSDKIEIEDNNTFQLCEVGMLEEKENITSTMKEKFEKNFNDLLSRLGDNCSSVSELDNKVTLLCNWVENHNTDYSKEEREIILNQLVDRYTEVKEILESNINELDVIFTDFCSIKEEKPIVEEKKTTTKEELIKNLQAFQESLVTYENLEDAKHQLHFYCNKEDKLIKEYGLTSMVGDIINEINLQIEANKAFLTTFNLQDKETYYNEEIMQENALKSISYKVDDTEDYPF